MIQRKKAFKIKMAPLQVFFFFFFSFTLVARKQSLGFIINKPIVCCEGFTQTLNAELVKNKTSMPIANNNLPQEVKN